MNPTENNNESFNLLDSSQAQREENGLEGANGPIAEEWEMEAAATPSGDASVGEMMGSPNSTERAPSPPTAGASDTEAPSGEAFGNSVGEAAEYESPFEAALNRKIVNLVRFLLVKFRRMELTTKAEMMRKAMRNYEEYYSVIFSKAAECMMLIFGVDMMEVDPFIHSYFLFPALGITYDGLLHGAIGVPKTGLVLIVLSIIYMENNCASEEVFWDVMSTLGLYAGNNHFIFGEPRSLITEDFVQEGYVQYRQVANSCPPHFEFLWGPRAYAETTKMKVLNFYARIVKQDPRSFPDRYAEALREEEERA